MALISQSAHSVKYTGKDKQCQNTILLQYGCNIAYQLMLVN